MVWRLLLMFLIPLISTAVHAAEPLELITAVRDAQRMNATRYPEGSIDADVVELNLADHVRYEAHIHQEWKGTFSYWKYSVVSTDTDSGRPKWRPASDTEVIRTDKHHIVYDPTTRSCSIAPITRFGLAQPILELRPAKIWCAILPFQIEARWDEAIDKTIATGKVSESHITELDGKITIASMPNKLPSGRSVFDLAQGGNLVHMTIDPYVTDTKSDDGIQTNCEWVEDGQGGYRLKTLRYTVYKQTVENPLHEITCTVKAFRPKEKISATRFSKESLHLPTGTQVGNFGATGKPVSTYVGGVKPKDRISDQTLEKLSSELQQEGLSAPKQPTP